MDSFAITSQETLDLISRHCPQALTIYLQCINRSDMEGRVFFSRELVEVDMSESWSKFRNRIKALAQEGLLEWHPVSGGISVTMALQEYDE